MPNFLEYNGFKALLLFNQVFSQAVEKTLKGQILNGDWPAGSTFKGQAQRLVSAFAANCR